MIDRVANPALVPVPAHPAPADPGAQGAPAASAPTPEVPLEPAFTAAPDPALVSRAYDLAALSAAMQSAARGDSEATRGTREAPAEPVHDANGVVEEAAARVLPPATAAAFARLLHAMDPEAPPAEVARAIEQRLAAGGLLFEAHARAALAAGRPGGEQCIAGILSDDLRVLLARLTRAAQSRPGPPAVPADEARTNETSGLSERESAAAGLLAERVLAEQLHLAYEWIADGVIAFELPLRLGEQQPRALVRFRKEAAEAGSAAPAACVVTVQVASETLGAVAAAARWQGGTCHAAFFVERPESVPALQGHVDELRGGLGAVFPRLTIDISVDPVRARRSPTRAPAPPLPGSVVSVRT